MEKINETEPSIEERIRDYKKVCSDLKRQENFTKDNPYFIVRTDGTIVADTLTFSDAVIMVKRYLCKNDFADIFAVLEGKVACEYTYDKGKDLIDPMPSIFGR